MHPFIRGGIALLAAALAMAGTGPRAREGKPLQTSPWGSGADAEQERFLLEAEIVAVKELGTGVTHPKKVTLRLGDRTGHAVWKDVQQEAAHRASGSARLDDTYFSDRWQHEVAAYRLDRLIGLEMVPVTVMRELDGVPGSLQTWIENAFSERDRVEKGILLQEPSNYARGVENMRAFDALIYNVDRSQENILFTEPGSHMWLIDHSRAFRFQRNLPPIKKKYRFEIAPELMEKIQAPTDETIEQAMGGLLTRGQIQGLLVRRQKLRKLAAEGGDR